jgi:transketolase
MSPASKRVERVRGEALALRRLVVQMAFESQTGHVGGGLSAADIVAALYFDVLRVRPEQPDWPDRDRFILSKGHAAAVWYAALARRGYFPLDELSTYRRHPTRLQGHPELGRPPGVEFMSGSLGHGLAGGIGMALGARVSGNGARAYVLLGDGEVQEGLVWEASLAAVNFKLGTLCALLDYNHQQSGGSVESIAPLEPVVDKWTAFGWRVEELDGHDAGQLLAAFDRFVARPAVGPPTFLVCHTVKGKGVSFMEHDNRWHSAAPDADRYRQALAELGPEVTG